MQKSGGDSPGFRSHEMPLGTTAIADYWSNSEVFIVIPVQSPKPTIQQSLVNIQIEPQESRIRPQGPSLDRVDRPRQANDVLIKICGICNPEDARAAIAADADFLGFIFVEGTPRALTPASAAWIAKLNGTNTVGVFRDSPLDYVIETRDALGLDWVQLHGSEPDSWLDTLGSRVIRRVPVPHGGVERSRVEFLIQKGVIPLIDPGAGDGIAADFRALTSRLEGLDYALAGGLTPDNVAQVVSIARPTMVDVSSGVDQSPRIKDHSKIRQFVNAARSITSAG